MIAVLLDAIDCVAKHHHAKDYRGRRLFNEATQWLLADEAEWPYAFECICAALDLDANAVRQALRLPVQQSVLVSLSTLRVFSPHDDLRSNLAAGDRAR